MRKESEFGKFLLECGAIIVDALCIIVPVLAVSFLLAWSVAAEPLTGAQMQHDHAANDCNPEYHWYMTDNCCSCKDCRPISGPGWSEIKVTPEGYVWESSVSRETYLIPFASTKIKRSQDGFYHGCEVNYSGWERADGKAFWDRCVFVPPSGS